MSDTNGGKPDAGMKNGNDPAMAEVRQNIDSIDKQLVELLNQRANWALRAGEVKKAGDLPAYAPEREQAVLNAASLANKGPLSDNSIRHVFSEVISACRAVQQNVRVAFLGPEHTYSHQAVLRRFGSSAELSPMDTINEVFDEVSKGRSQVGVVPVENSTEGHVSATLDALTHTDLRVCGEVYLGVNVMVMSRENELSQITTLYSHPQPLGQCRQWLAQNLPNVKTIEANSTAAAAKLAAEDEGAAALGSEMLAGPHGLNILAGSIQDSPYNKTRFLIIGRQSCARTGHDKTSVVFSTSHQPGSLYSALGALSVQGMNMTHILSRPMKDRPWEYVFFVDFLGHEEDPGPEAALDGLKSHVAFFKILGSYPVGKLDETP